jgi:hypothetical protein
MLGISVHGLLGVDADLQRSAFAAHQQQKQEVRYHSVRVLHDRGDCDGALPPPRSNTRT